MFKKIISEGEMIPEFYGIAYRDFSRREVVCYPIVINLIIRYLRELYFIIAIPAGLSRSEHIVQAAYRQGYNDGLEAAERKKDDGIMDELEGYIMGYLRRNLVAHIEEKS